MSIDKNMELSDLIHKIKIDKYTLIFSTILLFLIVGGIYFNSMLIYNNNKNEKILKEKREKTNLVLDTKKTILKEEESIKEFLDKISNFQIIFYNQSEKDKFIESLNTLILKHNLLTLNIVKLREEIIKNQDETNPEKNFELFEKIDFKISINGDFNEYMAFKEEMILNKKLLTINNEIIKNTKEENGIVEIELNLSIYKLIEMQNLIDKKDVK